MRIRVAGRTVGHLCTMRLIMAGAALGHYIIIVSLFYIIGVKCAVALLAVELVFPTIHFYVLKHARVALSALLYSQRLGYFAVKLRIGRYLNLHLPALRGGQCRSGY